MLALMAICGLPTSTSMLLNALSYGDFSHASIGIIFVAIAGVFATAAVVGIIIGLFTRQSIESSLVATLSASLLTIFIADMVSIVSYFNGICPAGSDCFFVSKLVFLIMFAMAAGFLISIVQWWRGNDI